ncbi:hypothetical protein BBJ29_008038 [Phytophthora kernoviae]|uniref:Uncharacterized protein n=1 Tax=Phytophthora kernoviae TaxID=325452 RepID=A0A3F2RDZ4_9STRA|nr:hypothetical protein BBJ29_008038 [Phytophthora kernoviae]RLN54380.1 hypothetical protein BBP00_00008962 [Phytophthora kernoviae]
MPRSSSGIFPRVPSMDKMPHVPSIDKIPRVASLDKLPRIPSMDKLHTVGGGSSEQRIPRVPSIDKMARVPSSDMLSRFGSSDHLSSFPSFSNLSALSSSASYDKLSSLGGGAGFKSGFPRNSSIEDILSLVASSESTVNTVFITGSNRGIGLTFARHYVANGWKVIAAARDVGSASDLKELAVSKIIPLDTSDETSISKVAEQLKGEPIDLLINNAGVGGGGGIPDVTKNDMMKLFEVNAVGAFLVTRALLPNLKLAVAKHGTATVCQISSIMGSIAENGSGGRYSYRASKAALNMLNMSLSIDLKDDKIVALALHPGYVATRMTANKGEVTKEESVAGLTKIIAEVKPEDSGKYFDFRGTNLPW